MSPPDPMQPTIVGAGPTGLAAALFLDRHGLRPSILESRRQPSRYSKAFGINARTLTLLEPTGLTERLLTAGRRLTAGNVWRHGRRVLRMPLTDAPGPYPFLVILAQSDTERLMGDRLAERGVAIRRELTVTDVRPDAESVALTVADAADQTRTLAATDVFAADGARSTLRTALGIEFPGRDYERDWKLLDVRLTMPVDLDEAHVFLLDDGFVFSLRIADDVWRLIGHPGDPRDHLPTGAVAGEVIWESDFRVRHRVAETFQRGRIALGGDAAHIHSPVGGRGMNLGIEDAWVYAELMARGRVADYGRLRAAQVRPLVRRIERITEIPRGRSALARLVRAIAPVVGLAAPLIRPTFQRFALGLDHEPRLE